MTMTDQKKKTDKLEKELEKFVIRTLRNAYADGVNSLSNHTCMLFSDSLKTLVELRKVKAKIHDPLE